MTKVTKIAIVMTAYLLGVITSGAIITETVLPALQRVRALKLSLQEEELARRAAMQGRWGRAVEHQWASVNSLAFYREPSRSASDGRFKEGPLLESIIALLLESMRGENRFERGTAAAEGYQRAMLATLLEESGAAEAAHEQWAEAARLFGNQNPAVLRSVTELSLSGAGVPGMCRGIPDGGADGSGTDEGDVACAGRPVEGSR